MRRERGLDSSDARHRGIVCAVARTSDVKRGLKGLALASHPGPTVAVTTLVTAVAWSAGRSAAGLGLQPAAEVDPDLLAPVRRRLRVAAVLRHPRYAAEAQLGALVGNSRHGSARRRRAPGERRTGSG